MELVRHFESICNKTRYIWIYFILQILHNYDPKWLAGGVLETIFAYTSESTGNLTWYLCLQKVACSHSTTNPSQNLIHKKHPTLTNFYLLCNLENNFLCKTIRTRSLAQHRQAWKDSSESPFLTNRFKFYILFCIF